MEIVINKRPHTKVPPVEIVERKGLGHPDTLADGISEVLSAVIQGNASRNKPPPYHYTDKVFLIGGLSTPQFGGGKIESPFSVHAAIVSNSNIPESELKHCIIKFFENRLHEFHPEHVQIHIHNIFPSAHSSKTYSMNPQDAEDSSVAVAWAPLSTTESIVYEIERFLNSKQTKQRWPMIGEDIKVLGVRHNQRLQIVVACAFIGKYLSNIREYLNIKGEIEKELLNRIQKMFNGQVSVNINPDDRPKENSVYLTVIGTSIENGDCGFTGRGNRYCGLISYGRPMSIEAFAGKNNFNHPGVLYNQMASTIAQTLQKKIGITEVFVTAVGCIGNNIQEPLLVYVETTGVGKITKSEVSSLIQKLGIGKDKKQSNVEGGA